MKNSRFLASWAVALASTLAVASLVSQHAVTPLGTGQQLSTTVVEGTTRVVVVVIPGFPMESIVLGALLGLTLLFVTRRVRGTNREAES